MSLPDFSRLSLQQADTGVTLVGHAQCDPNKSGRPCMRLKPSLHNWRLAEPLLGPGITMDSCTMMVTATSGLGWARDTPYYTVKNSWQWQVFLELVRERLPGYKVSFHLAVTSEAWLQAGRSPALIPNKDPNATWFHLAKDRGFFDGDLHGSRHKDGKYIIGFVSFKERRPEVLAALFTTMHEYNQRFLNPVLKSPVEPEEEAPAPAPAPAPAVAPKELERARARQQAQEAREAKQARREEARVRLAQKRQEQRAWQLQGSLQEPPRAESPPLEVAAEPVPESKEELHDALEQLMADDVWDLLGPEPVPDPVPEPARAPEPELAELPTDEEVRNFAQKHFGW